MGDLGELLGGAVALHAGGILQEAEAEVEEEQGRRVVRVLARQQVRQREPQSRREHRHDRERADGAQEDHHARVAHRQDRGLFVDAMCAHASGVEKNKRAQNETRG